jgi:hypothetical protein
MTDLRDALKTAIGAAFEASGHNYSVYLIDIAADTAIEITGRWEAKEPDAKPKRAAKSKA